MKKLIPLLFVMAGCANDPIIDMRGVNEAKYRQDLGECRSYAAQVDTGGEMVKRGVVGAAVGGLLGAAIDDSETAARAAGAGAVGGVAGGAGDAEDRKQRILYNCLKGRGYRVLG